MRRVVGIVLLMAAGCAHRTAAPPLVLNQREPYDALPAYLRCPEPKVVEVTACPFGPRVIASRESGRDYAVRPAAPAMTKMERLDRLRALLAVVDAHVAALGDQPTADEVQALRLSVAELRKLLDAWPDVLPEADELGELVEKLSTTIPISQPPLRKRMNQLADLIRVQVVLAGE